MNDTVAVVDLGTNTFHLLIAGWRDNRPHVLHQERRIVKLGMGGINEGIITPAGISRCMAALNDFKKVIDGRGVTTIFGFGTSALRSAKNGSDLAFQIQSETGIPVKIISGDEEANFIYLGVRLAAPLGDQTSLIVDIGAGSVEFIIGNDSAIFWKQSFEVGAQRLLELFQKHDPILPEEILQVDSHLNKILNPLTDALQKFHPTVLVGSSGTFDTLSEIYCARNRLPYPEQAPETPLTHESFYETFRELKSRDRAGRLRIPGMIEMRVDMIVVACCLIDLLFRKQTFDKLRVSTYSLKEGVLVSLFNKDTNK